MTTDDIGFTRIGMNSTRSGRRRGGQPDRRARAADVVLPRPDQPRPDGGRRGLAITENTQDTADRGDAAPGVADLMMTHRTELHAHCYRMLGSVHDADDALQETLVRAWRGAAGLNESGSIRSWLYRIATNVCLTEIARRRKRVLPHDFGPPADGSTPPGSPVTESLWLEPYPDRTLGLTNQRSGPDACYDQREAVELAFVAALQHLKPRQRATLILREVLGFSAQETAGLLLTSVASVNSELQRARAVVSARVPERTQQATLRSLGDRDLQRLVERYVSAWERCDIDAFTALLVEDATFTMPPLTTWYTPRDAIATWARATSMSGAWQWRVILTQANAQPALAFYAWDRSTDTYQPFALNVLTLRDNLISEVTAFIVRATDAEDPNAYIYFPDQPMDQRRLGGTFDRFDLPKHLATER
jgi:RNA polymerase sigma-70 factor, ECF subfamily